jgi:MFS family permease
VNRPSAAARPHTGAVLAIILVSYFMILLDNSIIFTGLPSIRAAMRLSPTGLSWVQDAYTLVFGGLLLLGARAGDLLGRRRIFVIGLAVFATASLLIGLAPTGWWLITARVAVTLAGMVWLSRLDAGSSYLAGVALPMVLLGVGQGLAFAPLTSAGIAGVTARDAGAASGLVNTAHQLGSALGLAVLVTASTTAAAGTGARALAGQVHAALAAGSVLLALCLAVSLALIVPAAVGARRAGQAGRGGAPAGQRQAAVRREESRHGVSACRTDDPVRQA